MAYTKRRIDRAETLFDEANNIFKELFKSEFPKLRYLDEWNNSKAKYLEHETSDWQAHKRRRFKKFERGQLVFIDFGVNPGSEFSGNHFGVIITKNDSIKKNIITVVPLTSKNKSFYMPIGTPIEGAAEEHFSKEFVEINKLYSALMVQISREVHDVPNEHSKEVIASVDEIVNRVAPSASFEEATEIINQYKARNKETQDMDTLQFGRYFIGVMENLENSIKSYRKYYQQSYADYSNIQAISKDRIKRIARLEPMIKLPKDTVDELVNKVMSNLI